MKTTLLCTALAAALLPLAAVADTTCPAVAKFAPGAISTGDHWEWRLAFTPSQTRAYWATSVGWWPGTRERSEIRTSQWHPQTGWQPGELVSFSGVYADFDPVVSPDGQTLYFSSMRPVHGAAKGDMDLWQVRRGPQGWGTPEHIAAPSIDGYDELYPSVDRAGNLYFARVKAPIPTEDVDIFVARRQSDGSYGPATRVAGGIDTPDRWEFNPEISPDGRTMLFPPRPARCAARRRLRLRRPVRLAPARRPVEPGEEPRPVRQHVERRIPPDRAVGEETAVLRQAGRRADQRLPRDAAARAGLTLNPARDRRPARRPRSAYRTSGSGLRAPARTARAGPRAASSAAASGC